MLLEPEKVGEEEAVAKRAFAKLLNASGDVDVARMSVHADLRVNRAPAFKVCYYAE